MEKGSRSIHLSCCPVSHKTNSDAKCNPASVKTVALVCHHSLFRVQLLNDRMWEMKSFLCPCRLFKIKIPEQWRGGRRLHRNPGFECQDTAWWERASLNKAPETDILLLDLKITCCVKPGSIPTLALLAYVTHLRSCLCPAPCKTGPAFGRKK